MWVLKVLGAMWVSRLHVGIIRVQEFQLRIVFKGQLHVLLGDPSYSFILFDL